MVQQIQSFRRENNEKIWLDHTTYLLVDYQFEDQLQNFEAGLQRA